MISVVVAGRFIPSSIQQMFTGYLLTARQSTIPIANKANNKVR